LQSVDHKSDALTTTPPSVAHSLPSGSGIAVHHAPEGYSEQANFSGKLARNMVLTYLKDGTNIYGSINGKFEGIGPA